MTNYEIWKKKQLEDPEIKAEYDALKPEFDIIFALAKARREQNSSQ